MIQRLALPSATPRARTEGEPTLPFAGLRLRVVAENTPLPRFAAALAEAIGFGVMVPLDAYDLQVTVASPDVSVDDLLRTLRFVGVRHRLDAHDPHRPPRPDEGQHGIDAEGVLRLDAAETLAAAAVRAVHADRYNTTRRVFAPRAGLRFAEVARYYCDRLASPFGAADVVEGRLIVTDLAPRIEQAEGLLHSLETHDAPATPTPPFSCGNPPRVSPLSSELDAVPLFARPPDPPAGSLVVQRLPGPLGALLPREQSEPPPASYAGVRLRVAAEAVPLWRFAQALSETLRITVAVAPGSLDETVTLAWPDVTAERLLRVLPDVEGIGDALVLGDGSDYHARRNLVEGPPPAEETRAYSVPAAVPPELAARLYCELDGPGGGTADVVAGRLVVRNYGWSADRIEDDLRRLAEFVTQRHREERPLFTCHGPPEPPRPTPPPSTLPLPAPGRLIVQRLPLPPAVAQPSEHTDRSRYEDPTPLPFGGVRLRIVAEGAPLRRVAVALSEALRMGVVSGGDWPELPVTITSSDITVDQLFPALEHIGVFVTFRESLGLLTLVSREPIGSPVVRIRGFHDPIIAETRLIPVDPGVSEEAVARHYCERLASPIGAAASIGGLLIVHDYGDVLSRAELLVRELASPTAPSGDAGAAAR